MVNSEQVLTEVSKEIRNSFQLNKFEIDVD